MKTFSKSIFIITITFFLAGACVKNEDSGSITGGLDQHGDPPNTDWLIPVDEVLDAAGQDGIPSIDSPLFVTASDDQGKLDWMDDEDLILAIKVGDEIRGYPHPILDWHEIINDDFNAQSVAITYCPLTGTGIGWNRNLPGGKTTFGVSGLLYNSNLMPYDRASESNWSQMRFDCVNGAHIGTEVQLYQLVEMPWKLWKEWFPEAKVLSGDEHGLFRPYDQYPYDDYKTQSGTLFPVARSDDDSLHDKERVLGIVANDVALLFRFSSFRFRENNLVTTELFGKQLVVFGSEKLNFMTAFYMQLEDGTPITALDPLQGRNEILARDSTGSEWNVFGEAVSGPLKGNRLVPAAALMGYWFTWPSFYQPAEIYGN